MIFNIVPVQINFDKLQTPIEYEYSVTNAAFQSFTTAETLGGNGIYCVEKQINLNVSFCSFENMAAKTIYSEGSSIRIETGDKINLKCNSFTHNTCYHAQSLWITHRTTGKINQLCISHMSICNGYTSSQESHLEMFGATLCSLKYLNYSNNELTYFGLVLDFPKRDDHDLLRYMIYHNQTGGNGYLDLDFSQNDFCVDNADFVDNNIGNFLNLRYNQANNVHLYECNFIFTEKVPLMNHCFLYNAYIKSSSDVSANIKGTVTVEYDINIDYRVCDIYERTCIRKKDIQKLGHDHLSSIILATACLELKK